MTIMLDCATPCVKFASLFQNPLLDEDMIVETVEDRRAQAALETRAASLCGTCPLRAKCLADAVVHHDVSGFVAGTTAAQRHEIRQRLGVSVAEIDVDSYAGINSGRTYSQAEIVRLRQANPTQPLSAIAARLGCSISTVKRHLRRQEAGDQPRPVAKPTRTPSTAEVMAAAAHVLHPAAAVA